MRKELRIKYPFARSTYARSLGWATSILASSNSSHRQFAYAGEVLEPAIRHEQIGFIADKYNRNVAFFIWATLHDHTIRMMEEKRSFPTYESDWNEMGSSTLIDLVTTQKLGYCQVKLVYSEILAKSRSQTDRLFRLKRNFAFKEISLKIIKFSRP